MGAMKIGTVGWEREGGRRVAVLPFSLSADAPGEVKAESGAGNAVNGSGWG